MLLYCVPRVIQMGARFQVRTRIDVAGMKVRPPPPPPRAPLGFIQGRLKGGQ
jgi:FYVE/RhoGEF/PH domain-containing protein 2